MSRPRSPATAAAAAEANADADAEAEREAELAGSGSGSGSSSRRWRGSQQRHERDLDANIRNFAPVARIMKLALPENAKIAKEAKECMQECVSEFISFITSEGTTESSPSLDLGEKIPPILSEFDLRLGYADGIGFDRQHPRNANRRNGRRSTVKTSSSP